MKRILAYWLTALVALTVLSHLVVRAEVLGSPSISSTDTGGIVAIARSVRDLTLINDSASPNEAYLRVFWCGEPALAATTSSPIRLEPGESISFQFGQSDGGDGGYCSFSHITAGGETATLRFMAK